MHHSVARIAIVATLAIAFVGCQKYEDGPFFSLRTKEQRVANHWKVVEATDNGTDVLAGFDEWNILLTKGGGMEMYYRVRVLGVPYESTSMGSWSFEDQKKVLRFDFDGSNNSETYEIRRLMERELWLRGKDNDLELRLEPL